MICSGRLPFFRNFGKNFRRISRDRENTCNNFDAFSIERTGICVALYVWQQSWDKLTETIYELDRCIGACIAGCGAVAIFAHRAAPGI